MRDSNPRMVGPEPTALPLGESPTLLLLYIKIAYFVKYIDLITLIVSHKFGGHIGFSI